jgi:hypothetical protein
MRVECGRARFGASSVLRAVVFGAFAAIGLFASGCGSTTLTYGTPVITMSVTPGPFKAYLVDLEGVTLTRSDGTATNLFGTNNITTVERVDLTKSIDLNELWGAPAVLTGTYTSATITVSYATAQIAVEVNGQIQSATIVDPAGVTAGVETYTFKFDPANPLVITQGALTHVNLDFDLSAGTIVNTSVSPAQVTVRPYWSVSTNPVYAKGMRARGVSVATNATDSTFTMNARPFYDDASNPFGAITVQTTGTTVYNVNGTNYTGAAGLAAIAALPINTTLAAYGSLSTSTQGTGASITPVFQATQVIAGISLENLAADRVIGTVSSISSTSGTTLNIHGAEVVTRPGQIVSDAATTQIIEYFSDLPVSVDSSTLVIVDGQPNTTANVQSISIGQQVTVVGQATANTTTGVINAILANGVYGGIVRLNTTPAWGTLNQAPANGQLSLNLATLGGFEPSILTFTGTGSATGADANATAYVVNATGLDTSALATGTEVRADGIVTPFGSAGGTQPDFTATAITPTPASPTEQLLVVDYIGGGTSTPFVTADTNGLVVNMSNANLGPTHVVQTGPFSTDLTNPLTNVTIVPTSNAQFVYGDPADNSTTGLSVFNSYSAFLTQVSAAAALGKIVALGQYNATTHTFSATRIDIVTWL